MLVLVLVLVLPVVTFLGATGADSFGCAADDILLIVTGIAVLVASLPLSGTVGSAFLSPFFFVVGTTLSCWTVVVVSFFFVVVVVVSFFFFFPNGKRNLEDFVVDDFGIESGIADCDCGATDDGVVLVIAVEEDIIDDDGDDDDGTVVDFFDCRATTTGAVAPRVVVVVAIAAVAAVGFTIRVGGGRGAVVGWGLVPLAFIAFARSATVIFFVVEPLLVDSDEAFVRGVAVDDTFC